MDEKRKKQYEERRNELQEHCNGCTTRSYERCNSCTWGKRLRWLQTEYSDVTGWSHKLWNQGK